METTTHWYTKPFSQHDVYNSQAEFLNELLIHDSEEHGRGTPNHFIHLKHGQENMDIIVDYWTWISCKNITHTHLAKLWYFTNLGFPEIRGSPLLNHHLGEVVWGRYNLTRHMQLTIKFGESHRCSERKVTVKSRLFACLVGGWSNPSEKYAQGKLDHFPK